MDWDVLLDNASIKDKIVSFAISRRKGNFCNELTLVLADYVLYGQFDFTEVPEAERIEVKTDAGNGWTSQGTFFIENPDVVQDKDGITVPSLWGRDGTARLTQPFARRINKEWDEDTTLKSIIQEFLEACGLEYSESRVLINDYKIYSGSYSATNRYPAEILQDLVAKTDGYLFADRQGNLWVHRDLYHWGSPEREIHGGLIQSITERVEFPDFGNRIKVGTFSRDWETNFDVQLQADDTSIAIGENTLCRAIVTHRDGQPVADGHPVEWTSDNDTYVYWQYAESHVKTLRIENEQQEASARQRVSTDYPIRQVHTVRTVGGSTDYFAGGSWSGRSITLGSALPFTDSVVIIDYETGYAENTLYAGSVGEVDVDVHAIVATYVRDTLTMSIESLSGLTQGEKDMNVTLIYRDFISQENIEGVEIELDGEVKGTTEEDGSIDLGLISGGAHEIKATKAGYQDSEGDGLDNDEIRVGT